MRKGRLTGAAVSLWRDGLGWEEWEESGGSPRSGALEACGAAAWEELRREEGAQGAWSTRQITITAARGARLTSKW